MTMKDGGNREFHGNFGIGSITAERKYPGGLIGGIYTGKMNYTIVIKSKKSAIRFRLGPPSPVLLCTDSLGVEIPG